MNTDNSINRLFSFLTNERLRESTRTDGNLIEATESDRGRVINSSAFRRLQQKAQVFPLEPNAAVRSRLTHSIEVSQIGRYIAQSILNEIEKKSSKLDLCYEKKVAFVSTVETACLLHDIGNPPFGHLGEAAIKLWFKKHIDLYEKEPENSIFKNVKDINDIDLIFFDGNPQGFRLVRLLSGLDNYGLNLTLSLLLSIIKYPRTVRNTDTTHDKIGLFQLCEGTYNEICRKLNWTPKKYFPYMTIMDAADEIAYSLSDLEDAIEKKIINEKALLQEFQNEFRDENLSTIFTQKKAIGELKFIEFKTSVIHASVKAAASNFMLKLDEILDGELNIKLIEEATLQNRILKKIKKIAIKDIYSHESAEKVELAGRNIIHGLLSHFEALLVLSPEYFKILLDYSVYGISEKGKNPRALNLDFELRLFRRLPNNHIDRYEKCVEIDSSNELLYRAHLIVDYISGMTDDFALETYQLLEGIRIK